MTRQCFSSLLQFAYDRNSLLRRLEKCYAFGRPIKSFPMHVQNVAFGVMKERLRFDWSAYTVWLGGVDDVVRSPFALNCIIIIKMDSRSAPFDSMRIVISAFHFHLPRLQMRPEHYTTTIRQVEKFIAFCFSFINKFEYIFSNFN